MCGDALGCAWEGWSRRDLAHPRHFNAEGVPAWTNFGSASHMGLYHMPPRFGMYTDDTNATLALAFSICEKGGLAPIHAAHMYGRFYLKTPVRGYPDSAKQVMIAVLHGDNFEETGRVAFPSGSYANGGVMRISPVGIAFRNATFEELTKAATWAVISSHCHPESVDGTIIQAFAISTLMKLTDPSQMTPLDFLDLLIGKSQNNDIKNRLNCVRTHFIENPRKDKETILKSFGDEFQIRASDALAVSLWGFLNNWNTPEQCLIDIVGYGGDTDTTAAIAGAMCGALHGTAWIPNRWYDNLENEERGRDFAVDLGMKLGKLDLHDLIQLNEQECEQIKAESKELLPKGRKPDEGPQCEQN